ncbi:MAG: flagellar hook-length control protein FliK, partial [Spirochaetia bacterium]
SPPRTQKKGAKGSAGHSSGLIHSLRKGETAFSQLVKAQAEKKAHPGASKLDPVEALKVALSSVVKSAHDKNGARAPDQLALALPAAHHAAKGGETSGSGEKTDGRKKPARPPALSVALALGAEAAQPAAAKPGQANGKDEQPAVQAAAVGPRQASAQAPHAKLIVVDLRRKPEGAGGGDAGTGPGVPHGASEKPSPSTLLLRAASGGRDGGFDPSAKPGPVTFAPHATPVERLREMAGAELLKASTMVLRDGGGEIRLVLKPESLGSVRIRMNVTDNSIDGKIIVDSSAVKQVFDGNIDALKRALTAEGFQMGSLQVSVGGQGAFENRQGQEREKPAAVRRVAAEDFQRNIPGVENLSLGELMVNLFV